MRKSRAAGARRRFLFVGFTRLLGNLDGFGFEMLEPELQGVDGVSKRLIEPSADDDTTSVRGKRDRAKPSCVQGTRIAPAGLKLFEKIGDVAFRSRRFQNHFVEIIGQLVLAADPRGEYGPAEPASTVFVGENLIDCQRISRRRRFGHRRQLQPPSNPNEVRAGDDLSNETR